VAIIWKFSVPGKHDLEKIRLICVWCGTVAFLPTRVTPVVIAMCYHPTTLGRTKFLKIMLPLFFSTLDYTISLVHNSVPGVFEVSSGDGQVTGSWSIRVIHNHIHG